MPDSPTQELAERRIGRLLNDKWRLEGLLGVGGTAAVYAATHRNGARVAVKILHAAISASDEARLRFKREGYIVNRIDHPGVVRVLDDDVDEADGSAFLVMDRADGVSLCERVMRRLLDENEVLEVTEQLLEILVAAHEKGVIHRDLKPDNLLIDAAGRVRLLDFGIARLLDDDANLTRTGFTFGTPAYMAPEQALGKKALFGPRTDLYAVGATIFTLLTGEYVQEAENAQELLIKIATQPARSLAEVRPETSPGLIDLVDRATMMHPEDRWPSADAMLARVRLLMRQRRFDAEPTPATLTTTTPTRPSLMRVGRSRGRRSLVLASAAALVLIGLTVGWKTPRAGESTAQGAAHTSAITTQAALEATPARSASIATAAPIAQAIAPTKSPIVTPKTTTKSTKRKRRNIDVGY